MQSNLVAISQAEGVATGPRTRWRKTWRPDVQPATVAVLLRIFIVG